MLTDRYCQKLESGTNGIPDDRVQYNWPIGCGNPTGNRCIGRQPASPPVALKLHAPASAFPATSGTSTCRSFWGLIRTDGFLSMRRLKRYFPIFMVALIVQILAPIGASVASAIALSDPLAAAEICHTDLSSQGSDQGGQHHDHDADCLLCCGFSANAVPASTPEPVALAAPYRSASQIVWRDIDANLLDFATGSNAKARAPPSNS